MVVGGRFGGVRTMAKTDGGAGEGRRGFHHGDLASALVIAASTLIASRGGPDFSLREVAESVGVSHTAAYRHFAAKADLLAEIAVRGFARLDKAVASAMVRKGPAVDPLASLTRAGLAYVDFAERHPGAHRVMFLPELCDKDRHPALAEAAARSFAALAELVAGAQAAGVLRADRPAAELAATIWAGVHGHALLLLDGQIRDRGRGPAGAPPADRDFLVATLVAGLAPPR